MPRRERDGLGDPSPARLLSMVKTRSCCLRDGPSSACSTRPDIQAARTLVEVVVCVAAARFVKDVLILLDSASSGPVPRPMRAVNDRQANQDGSFDLACLRRYRTDREPGLSCSRVADGTPDASIV